MKRPIISVIVVLLLALATAGLSQASEHPVSGNGISLTLQCEGPAPIAGTADVDVWQGAAWLGDYELECDQTMRSDNYFGLMNMDPNGVFSVTVTLTLLDTGQDRELENEPLPVIERLVDATDTRRALNFQAAGRMFLFNVCSPGQVCEVDPCPPGPRICEGD